MKKFSHLIGLLLLSANIACIALPTPKYLSVPKWKICTSTEMKGSAKFVCLPAQKPCQCPAASWKKLTAQHLLKPCS